MQCWMMLCGVFLLVNIFMFYVFCQKYFMSVHEENISVECISCAILKATVWHLAVFLFPGWPISWEHEQLLNWGINGRTGWGTTSLWNTLNELNLMLLRKFRSHKIMYLISCLRCLMVPQVKPEKRWSLNHHAYHAGTVTLPCILMDYGSRR